MKKAVLALDFGASTGRAMVGHYDGKKISINEIHRFPNDPVSINGTLYWDVLRLFHEIKNSLLKTKHLDHKIESIAINTWGVDFGLLDIEGRLIENPIHYRDKRTCGIVQKALNKITIEELYNITGIQIMEINTIYQLLSLVENRPQFLKQAQTLLFMPDLFNYFLTGVKNTEYSIASTSQLLNSKNRTWSNNIFDKLNLPKSLCTPIIEPGTIIGELSNEVFNEIGISKTKVVSIASHDTACAVVAVPSDAKDFIYISSGTWSLIGTELDNPIVDMNSQKYNITNEGGFNKKIRFLKNITGLWLIQESQREWNRQGKEFSFDKLDNEALSAKYFQCFIDPDNKDFSTQGDIPSRIKEFCKQTKQYVPQSVGDIVLTIYSSLALKYRFAFEQIIKSTGKEYNKIHIIGGGSRSQLLCQMTANACGVEVIAGPVEATVFGNIAMQLIALGEIEDLQSARKIIAKSENFVIFKPKDTSKWDIAYNTFKNLIFN